MYFGEIQEMTRETTKAAGPKDETAASQFMALTGDNAATLSAMIEASNAMLMGMMTIARETIEFSNERLRESLEASQRLMGCKDPNEAFGMQCELARAANQQFLDEASKLMNLAAEMTRLSWAPLELRTREALGRLDKDN